jgi:hypothetical protein
MKYRSQNTTQPPNTVHKTQHNPQIPFTKHNTTPKTIPALKLTFYNITTIWRHKILLENLIPQGTSRDWVENDVRNSRTVGGGGERERDRQTDRQTRQPRDPHTDSPVPATKGRNHCIKMRNRERPESRTSKLFSMCLRLTLRPTPVQLSVPSHIPPSTTTRITLTSIRFLHPKICRRSIICCN